MTREEAIQILADLIDSPFLHTWEKQNKALHMAIEALSAPQTDLINRGRADAIEAIQNAYCKPCKERGDDYNEVRCRVCEYDNAIIQIDALPSAEAEWIPCSERLPSKNQEVLLQCHHNMIVGYWMDGDFDGEKEWRALSGDGWENGCDFPTDVFEPLAWMPLPKPYSEESEI